MLALLTIALLHLLAVITPGPDFALIVKNALSYSRKAAIYSAAGIASSVLIHCCYCVLGLAVVIANSIVIFNIIKFLGAAYLIYIGIKTLFAKKDTAVAERVQTQTEMNNFAAFRQGVLCNLLNPKATLFFLGIFTLVVKPETSIAIQVLYSLEMGLMTLVWFALLATIIGHKKVKEQLSHLQYTITKVSGGFLVAFGCKLGLLTP